MCDYISYSDGRVSELLSLIADMPDSAKRDVELFIDSRLNVDAVFALEVDVAREQFQLRQAGENSWADQWNDALIGKIESFREEVIDHYDFDDCRIMLENDVADAEIRRAWPTYFLRVCANDREFAR